MGWFSSLFGGSPETYTRLKGDGDYLCEVVGESKYQDALAQLTGGKTEDGHEFECRAMLEPEPRNPYDRNAVVVTIDGLVVGYLSRQHAKSMVAIFKKHRLAGAESAALIVGGWSNRKGRKPEGYYGVRLDIPMGD